mgnify:CR=1 FL=1
METVIEIENLKCHGCANTIKKSIAKMNGITKVEELFNPESELIEFDEKLITRNDILQTLSKLGYPEKGNNSLIKNMKSYVSCAIGRINK